MSVARASRSLWSARPLAAVLVAVLAAVLAALATLLVAGCGGCGTSALPVRKVLVDVDPAATLDREAVRASVHAVLSGTRGVRLVEDGERSGGAVLRVSVDAYHAAEGPDDKASLALAVEISGLPGEPVTSQLRGHSTASASGRVDSAVLVEQSLRDALSQVLQTRAAGDLDTATLVSWLDGGTAGDDQRRRAIRVLGNRRATQAVPALSRLLASASSDEEESDEHDEQALLALAALTNIGDPAAIAPVIDFSDRKPPPIKRQCIDAVRAMLAGRPPSAGGNDGRAWLFVLSTGADDASVRDHAATALAAVEGQGRQADATPPVATKGG